MPEEMVAVDVEVTSYSSTLAADKEKVCWGERREKREKSGERRERKVRRNWPNNVGPHWTLGTI